MYAGEKKKKKPKTLNLSKFNSLAIHNHCSITIDQKLNHTAQVYISIIEGCCDLKSFVEKSKQINGLKNSEWSAQVVDQFENVARRLSQLGEFNAPPKNGLFS